MVPVRVPDEVPRIKNRKAYEQDATTPPDWRIACCYVGKGRRRAGVATAALAGALDLIAELGGGTVEGYPEDAAAVPAGFLYNGALSTYDQLGFRRDRMIGKHRWVVTTRAAPATRGSRRPSAASPQRTNHLVVAGGRRDGDCGGGSTHGRPCLRRGAAGARHHPGPDWTPRPVATSSRGIDTPTGGRSLEALDIPARFPPHCRRTTRRRPEVVPAANVGGARRYRRPPVSEQQDQTSATSGPLAGVRVVELGLWLAAPACATVLADWGADVVKIEPLAGDPFRGLAWAYGGHMNPPFELDNRGKRSVAVDLRTEGGQQVLWTLLDDADVFVTNYRPGGLERIGLDWPTVHARQPRLIYGSITGYGLDGPERDRASYDMGAYWGAPASPRR